MMREGVEMVRREEGQDRGRRQGNRGREKEGNGGDGMGGVEARALEEVASGGVK